MCVHSITILNIVSTILACTSTISLPALINWSCVSHPTIQNPEVTCTLESSSWYVWGQIWLPLTSRLHHTGRISHQQRPSHTKSKSSQSITKSIWCSASDARLIRVTSGAVARSQGSIGRQVRPWPAQVHSAWFDSNVKDIQRYNSNQFYISHITHGCCVFADD